MGREQKETSSYYKIVGDNAERAGGNREKAIAKAKKLRANPWGIFNCRDVNRQIAAHSRETKREPLPFVKRRPKS